MKAQSCCAGTCRAIRATLPDVHIMNVMIGDNQEADKANRQDLILPIVDVVILLLCMDVKG
jgi:hypothetical protein